MIRKKIKTYLPDANTDKTRAIDARGKILGRLATEVATVLRGKDKPQFAPNKIVGDKVVVTNARFVVVTGTNKKAQKLYYRHSGYLGHLRSVTLKQLLEQNPSEVVERAIAGMLPKNRLHKELMKRLTVYAEDIK